MDKYEVIGDVKCLGGMIGIEFVIDKQSKTPTGEIVSKIVKNAVEKGLMLENSGTYGQVIRFLALLVMTDEQLKVGFEIFEEAIKESLN